MPLGEAVSLFHFTRRYVYPLLAKFSLAGQSPSEQGWLLRVLLILPHLPLYKCLISLGLSPFGYHSHPRVTSRNACSPFNILGHSWLKTLFLVSLSLADTDWNT